jgi:predicted amino acid racemase
VYLDVTRRRNPGLIASAIRLHQSGEIPANSYVVDLDAIRSNAAALAAEAERVNVRLYLMTKHFNRNPLVTHTALAAGIASTVGVDVQCALALARFGLPLGHAGHLVQIPTRALPFVVRMRPEVLTVFSVEKARQISHAAAAQGLVQPVLLRVRGDDDIIYPNEEGGIDEADLDVAATTLAALPGLKIAGVVTFPATLFSPLTRRTEPTPNFDTLCRAAARLVELGFEVTQVNAPGASYTGALATVAAAGGTVAEPGHALTGTTPAGLYDDIPERPAMIYVSEVSHEYHGKAYVIGGGFYACDTPADVGDDSRYHTDPWRPRALVGSEPGAAMDNPIPVDVGSFFGRTNNATDYYGGTLLPEGGATVRVGDTAVYGFRPQAFTTRAHMAVLADVENGEGRVVGVFDRGINLVDRDGLPHDDTAARVRTLLVEEGTVERSGHAT